MNVVSETNKGAAGQTKPSAVSAPFFVRGKLVEGTDVRHKSRDLGVDFLSPKFDLDAAITPRSEPGPLFNVKLADIIDFLVACGEHLEVDKNEYLQACLDMTSATNVLPRRIMENQFRMMRDYLRKDLLNEVVQQNFGDPRCLDEWLQRRDIYGRKSSIRAFPPRLIHVLPGNSPLVAIHSIAQGAMVKAINLFKMGSSDPFTTVAILRTMAELDPNHPVVKSMTAVYWRGGDESVERTVYRPQYFDKIVAWGGGDAINNVIKYLGPGFQLISFDPKTSISLVGVEAFESDAVTEDAADRAAADVMILNQEACVASRFIFTEGTVEQVDKFCGHLVKRLGVDRETGSADSPPPPSAMVEEIEGLRILEDDFRVWGKPDGRGLVIRSDEPVDFHPTNKTVNVVRVPSLKDALRYVNVATQTVGVFPFNRAYDLRDGLATAGTQRVTRLGECGGVSIGNPHDAMYPLHRFVHWMAHEDGKGN